MASYVGAPVTPREYRSRLTGSASYTADCIPDGCLHAAFLRASQAAGRIVSCDVSAARELDGVVAVLTGSDLSALGLKPRLDRGMAHPRFTQKVGWEAQQVWIAPVAVDSVKYVGDPVAIVVATSRYIAEDALELIEIEYDDPVPSVNPDLALQPGAHIVHADSESNLAARLSLTYGSPPMGIDGEFIEIVRDYELARQAPVPLEGRGVVAAIDNTGHLSVLSSTQAPNNLLKAIYDSTDWEKGSVSVRAPAVGGAFGGKTAAYGEDLTVIFVARLLGRSVCWIEDRYENLVAATQGRDQVHRTRMVVDREGRIAGWEDTFTVDLGAWCWAREGVLGNTMSQLLGPYAIPYVRIEGIGVFTNKAPTAQFRGAGRPEAVFALETSLSAAARVLGIGFAKVREVNLLTAAELPYERPVAYRDGLDIVLDGKDYQRVLSEALEMVPESEIAALKDECPADHRIGVGIAAYVEATGRGPDGDSVEVSLRPDGRIAVRTGGGPSGQGHETALAQIAADVAGVGLDQVEVTTGDPAGLSLVVPTAASRTAVLTGSATKRGAVALVHNAQRVAAHMLGDAAAGPTANGGWRSASGTQISWAEIADWAAAHPDSELAAGLNVIGEFRPTATTWIMSVHIAVIDVSVLSGQVRVIRYALADESGPSINPRLVDGQLRGAVAQGISGALLEEIAYSDDGQPTTSSLMDYRIASAVEIPDIRLRHIEHPSASNDLGVKGVGESGIIACGAVIASAVEDALQWYGVELSRMPIDTRSLVGQLHRTGR